MFVFGGGEQVTPLRVNGTRGLGLGDPIPYSIVSAEVGVRDALGASTVGVMVRVKFRGR